MGQKVPQSIPHPGGLSRRAHWAGGQPIANLLMAKTLAHPELISLAAGFVDHQTLPVEPTRQALDAIWSNPEQARAVKKEIHRLRDSGGAALKRFGLTGKQCSITAAGVAQKAGIEIETTITQAVPQSTMIRLYGYWIPFPLWNNRPELSSITYAIPDKAADEMLYWRGAEEYHKICKP